MLVLILYSLTASWLAMPVNVIPTICYNCDVYQQQRYSYQERVSSVLFCPSLAKHY